MCKICMISKESVPAEILHVFFTCYLYWSVFPFTFKNKIKKNVSLILPSLHPLLFPLLPLLLPLSSLLSGCQRDVLMAGDRRKPSLVL